jgi:poly-gamma-glutamate capsule biosynthesis protein CapA/YwtB (metallophosphatase superfamily)
MANILIGADICPIEGNRPYFAAGDAENLFHDLLPEMRSSDLVIANLECPLIRAPSPMPKTGPIFGESPDVVRGIQAAGIGVLCLANNHILDHGPRGLKSTMDACRSVGIETVGAGANLESASRMLIRNAGGVRVGIMACAETEFSIATASTWGACPLDLPRFVRTVRSFQGQFDHLIVLVHGSAEFHAPTPRIQDVCRFLVEMGANTVVVQHPHVLGGSEDYQGGHIVYGQGALVMDEAIYRSLRSFHEGFLLKVSLEPGKSARYSRILFEQSDPMPGARRLQDPRQAALSQELEQRSRAILSPEFVEKEWRSYCTKREHGYISSVLGHGGLMRRLNSNGFIERVLHGSRRMLGVRNIVACETHAEAIRTILDDRRLPYLTAASQEVGQETS